MKTYHVYILTNKRYGTLYIGMTDDIERRIRKHKAREVHGFTKKYNIDKLIYMEPFDDSYKAFRRERQMKKWKRVWKIELIEKDNPKWIDLFKDWS